MSLRDRHKAETRAALLEAASVLFAERGFDETTTRAVAQRAGVATGTVFAHFPDKESLVEAILFAHVEPALTRGFATLPPGGLVPELVHVATTLYAAYDERPELAKVLVKHSLFVRRPEGPMAGQLARFEGWCAERVMAAIARGEVPPVAPELAFVAFFSHYFAILVGGLDGAFPREARGPMLEQLLRRFFGTSEAP